MSPRPLAIGPLLLVASLLAVTLIFWPTFRDLLRIGSSDGEFTHRIFVFPIFLATVWSLRIELAMLPIHAFWPGLLCLAGAGFLWLVGELTFIRLFTDIAVIALVPLVVLTALGYRWLWASSFPLFFLLFAVPVRGPIVDLQVTMTAKFTHLGLIASGFPVHREGPYFELPSGKWSIAEACSGIEYVSACMMFTVLFAWTMYNSTRKRMLFIVGGILVGIGGNWLRAYLTIAIAHLSDNRFLRHGHGTFGWILFAVLLFTYCWIGWYFRDREAASGISAFPAPKVGYSNNLRAAFPMMAAPVVVLLTLAIWPVIGSWYGKDHTNRSVEVRTISPQAGWLAVDRTPTDWIPTLVNPTVERVQYFEKNGRLVGVFVGIFAGQTWRSKLVSSVNNLIAPESARWSLVERGTQMATYLEKPLQVKTGVILGGSRIMARQWYWIHGVSTSNDIQAKMEQLRARLEGRTDVSAWITVFAIVDSTKETTSVTLDEFTRDMGVALEKALALSTTR